MKPALLALAAFGAACAQPLPSPAPSPLMGTSWVTAGGDDNTPSIEFSENRAVGYGGCNRWFSQVQAEGLSLKFENVGATRRMCSPEEMATEQAFFAALNQTRTARLDAEDLVLIDSSGAELARFTRR